MTTLAEDYHETLMEMAAYTEHLLGLTGTLLVLLQQCGYHEEDDVITGAREAIYGGRTVVSELRAIPKPYERT